MQISPRYDGEPIIAIDVPPDVVVAPFVRQRRRLVDTLGSLTPDQWRSPSRCEGWSAQDVVTHLTSTDGFWGASLSGGIAGEPTRFLVGFDPQASPAAMVDAAGSVDPAETLAAITESTTRLTDAVEALTIDELGVLTEAPPGHISASAMLHHALWDCWVHERDICLPLGLAVPEEADEVVACLRYGLALAPAFALAEDPTRVGMLGAAVDEPSEAMHAVIDGSVCVRPSPAPDGAPVLGGRAVDVVEALSIRMPLQHDIGPDDRWLVEGLQTVFDQ